MEQYITLYHGTNIDEKTIREDGLRLGTCERIIANVKKSLDVDTLPMQEIFDVMDVKCRDIGPRAEKLTKGSGDTGMMGLYTSFPLSFTDIKDQAIAYATKSGLKYRAGGGETANIMVDFICTKKKYEGYRREYKPKCELGVFEPNPKVVTVNVPKSAIDKRHLIEMRLIDKENEEMLIQFPHEKRMPYVIELHSGINIVRDINPENIVKIERIDKHGNLHELPLKSTNDACWSAIKQAVDVLQEKCTQTNQNR